MKGLVMNYEQCLKGYAYITQHSVQLLSEFGEEMGKTSSSHDSPRNRMRQRITTSRLPSCCCEKGKWMTTVNTTCVLLHASTETGSSRTSDQSKVLERREESQLCQKGSLQVDCSYPREVLLSFQPCTCKIHWWNKIYLKKLLFKSLPATYIMIYTLLQGTASSLKKKCYYSVIIVD